MPWRSNSVKEQMEHCRLQIETALAAAFAPRGAGFDGLLESMSYSLLAGGKRVRPLLVLEFCRISGGDPALAMPVACGVEMLHTYSLIHDDLPCMDDDDLRRGKPTNHKKFGECTAVLAGDALQAEAFAAILRSQLPAARKAACAESLAAAAGVDGICGGQFLDMAGEGKHLDEAQLTELQRRKTGSLLMAACRMGVQAAGGTAEMLAAADAYGAALGLAFQIRDDMLDELANEAELGKPVGSDLEREKSTFMALYGAEKCQNMVLQLTEKAKNALSAFPEPGFLAALADQLAGRMK